MLPLGAPPDGPVAHARLRLRAVRDTARRLGPASRHSVSARFLLNLCSTALAGLSGRLDSLQPDDEPQDVGRVVENVLGCAAFIHLLLPFASEPSLGRVPQALAGPLGQVARTVVERSRMLIYYDWRPGNYSFRREFPQLLRRVLLEALTEGVHLPECQ